MADAADLLGHGPWSPTLQVVLVASPGLVGLLSVSCLGHEDDPLNGGREEGPASWWFGLGAAASGTGGIGTRSRCWGSDQSTLCLRARTLRLARDGKEGFYGGLSCLPHALLLPLNPEIICFRAGQGLSHEGKSFMDCSGLLSSFFLSE